MASAPAASASVLPAPAALPALPAVLSFVTPNLALTQAETTVASLLTTVQSTVKSVTSAGGAIVTGLSPALSSTVTSLVAAIKQTVADAAALNVTAVGDDLTAAASTVETELQGELAVLESLGLSQGLTIAQHVVTPTCSLLATPTSLLGGLGLNLLNFAPVLAPITQLDAKTDALIGSTYKTLYQDIVNAATSALGPSGALLSLLEYDVHTTYHPPNGGAPVVRDTPALLDVPTPLDVDGSTGFDLCATLSVGTDGTIDEQISKMPLANPLLPVDVSAQLLNGAINLGTNTGDSTVPINFSTAYSSTNGTTAVDNTYLVQRGGLLSLPPLLPILKPLVVPSPTPIVTQVVGIGAGSPVTASLRYQNVPGASHVRLSSSPSTNLSYTADVSSDEFSYALATGSTKIGTSSTPAPPSVDFCYSTNSGACSDAPAAELATDKGSLSLNASAPVKIDQFLIAGTTGDGVSCTALPVLDAHFTASKFYLGQTPGTTSSASGAIWADSGGKPVSGCVSMIGLNATLPTGFAATQRQALYHTIPLGADAKSGSVTCPTGTTLTLNLLTNLAPVLCPVPPVNSVLPTVTGTTFVGSTLTGHNGTWTGAPNAPAFTYQWQRCDSSGANCSSIPGATAITYTPPVGAPPSSSADLGKTLRLVVTGTNADGHASATSAATAPITLPPAPVLVTAPAISGTLGSGQTLNVTNGTWNNGVSSFAYQWTRCDRDGVSHCAPATGVGATTSSYVVPVADEGSTLEATVTATNLGGTNAATSTQVTIPGVPTNSAPPVVQDGGSPATGNTVLAGDHLKVTNGTWNDATSFTYQWQSCDATATTCSDITGETSQTYVVANGDVGSTLRAIVTGHNANQAPDGSADAIAGATGLAIANNQQLDTGSVVPDGTVNASAPGPGGTSYVGGSFDTVGPFVGGAAAVSTSTTAVAHAAQALGGAVKTVRADGSGGYFLGGSFTSVLGTSCAGLAHVTSAGALDPAYCLAGLSGEVRALDQIGTLLAVGGSFSVAGHSNLVFVTPGGSVSGVTGGDPNAAVNAIADDGPSSSSIPVTSFYVGGDFTSLAGSAFGHLAKLQPAGTTVAPVGWPASVTCGSTCTTPTVDAVSEIAFSNGLLTYILVGGRFDNAVGGASPQTPTARRDAAAFGTGTNAAVGGWNPNPDGEVRAVAVPVTNLTTAAPPSPVYLGGDFTHIGATTNVVTVSHLGEFSINSLEGNGTANGGATATSSPSTVWTPNANAAVDAITVSPAGNVYVGGAFTSINATTRHRIAEIGPSATTAPALLSFDPNAGQQVYGLAHDASNIYVGGGFAVLGGTTRLNAAQISPSSGVTSWNPAPDGTVDAVAVNASGVWLGGAFTHAGGAARGAVGLVDSSSGAALGGNPALSGTVRALASDGNGGVYAGGLFTSSGPANLADVGVTGALGAWTTGVDGAVDAISMANGGVYIGGTFGNAGGAIREDAAELDPTSGAATGWNPAPDGAVQAIAANTEVVYLGGSFANAGGAPRVHVAAVDPSTGDATSWNPGTDGAVDSLALLGDTVYIGGSFSEADGGSSPNLAALSGSDGTPTSFAPGPDGPVLTVSAASSGLLTVGGSFVTIGGGVTSPNLAFFGG
ncbi:MAG TPA: hypothetical protein VHV76_07785 [Mycobacteriales bacterium]|nr:hypothetical protein [Mycobacteriales bacterium]